ncbi:unnamed protein product [Clonostachys rosea f. rosea IK726]|uniref:Uncharacterized protein n=1 Tax=Clonostachys rosea f. rosea IK726 TaxID=1349383 RepID=A0ACA9UHA8_BIOOC|nr:unnamed protein product [Clonostachys rosea f. rosea IK726]
MSEDPPAGKGKEPLFPGPKFAPRTADLGTVMEEVRGNHMILMHEMKEGLQKNTDALTDMRSTTVTLLEQMLVQLTLFNTNQTTPATSTTENKPAQQGRSAAELLEHLTWSKSNRTGQSQDKVEQPQGEKPAQMKNATSTA